MDRSYDERVADAYWPLIPFFYGQLYGRSIGRIMAYFFGCQPSSLFKAWAAELEPDNREAFLSPTWRRRRRDEVKKGFKGKVIEARLQGLNVRQMGRETLLQMYEGIRRELQGSNIEQLSNGEIQANWPAAAELDLDTVLDGIDLSRIPKFSELEMRQRQEAEEISKATEEVAEVFPMHLTVDGRLRNEILVQVTDSDGYASTVADIVAEVKLNPETIKQSTSAIRTFFKVFPLARELKEAAELPQGFRIIGKMIGRFMVLSRTPQGEELVRKMIGNMLIDQFVEHPYTKYRRESLEEAAEKGLELADSQVEEQSTRVEERAILESSLEQLPASQREDSQFFLEAGDFGKSPRELRDELGEKRYKAKQRNFERGLKGLENLRRSGKLGL